MRSFCSQTSLLSHLLLMLLTVFLSPKSPALFFPRRFRWLLNLCIHFLVKIYCFWCLIAAISFRKLFQQTHKGQVSRLWGYEEFKSKCIQGKPQLWRKEAGKGIKKESRPILHLGQRSVYKSQGFKVHLVARSNKSSFLIYRQLILAYKCDLILITSKLLQGSKGRCHCYRE